MSKFVKLYLTKMERSGRPALYNYITDVEHPTRPQQMGLINVTPEEVKLDQNFNPYVEREIREELGNE